MLNVVFGLPAGGKTTHLAMSVYKYWKKKNHGFIYSNVRLKIPHVIYIDPRVDIGTFEIFGGQCWIDESSQQFDSRDFKNMTKAHIKYFNEYRHHNMNFTLYVQKYDAIDAKIRAICDNVFWVRRYKPFNFYRVWRIPHQVLLAKEADASKLSGGEIVQGYVRPDFISRLFAPRFRGKKYQNLFDSYWVDVLPPLPERCFVTQEDREVYLQAYKEYADNAELRKKQLIEYLKDVDEGKGRQAGKAGA